MDNALSGMLGWAECSRREQGMSVQLYDVKWPVWDNLQMGIEVYLAKNKTFLLIVFMCGCCLYTALWNTSVHQLHLNFGIETVDLQDFFSAW